MLATDAVGGGALPRSQAKAHHHGLPPAPAGHTQHPFPAAWRAFPGVPPGARAEMLPLPAYRSAGRCLQANIQVLQFN